MALDQHDEIERKYDVAPDTAVPDLSGVAVVEPVAEVVQTAAYFDTPDLRLLRSRVTLRRRVGGHDDGWHLKLPGDGDARTEVQLPPGTDPTAVPAELLDRVRVVVRRERVAMVAELTTHRTVHRLRDADGVLLAELCDDRVRATTSAGSTVEQWREWEVELVAGDRDLLDAVEELLEGVGAVPSSSRSKLARVLAEQIPVDVAAAAEPTDEEPSTGDLLLRYLRDQTDRLLTQDLGFRTGSPVAVHQLRVAARRMRSALASYRGILEPGSTEQLEAELRWLGSVLGAARDTEVLQARLDSLLDDQPSELVRGTVRDRIDAELDARAQEGRSEAERALSSERHLDLVERLVGFVAAPPFHEEAHAPADEGVPAILDRARRRIERRHRAWTSASEPDERHHLLHEVRKAAKRLRYAAETAAPAFGDRAWRLAGRAEALQELLGEHQDLTVARGFLAEAAERADAAGESSFTFGRLHALEEWRSAEIVAAYPAVLRRLPKRPLHRWLSR